MKLLSNHPIEYAALFSTVRTLREFDRRIKELSASLPFYPSENNDEQNKFKGDSLEILAELFFCAFQNDPRFGLRSYEVVPLDEDMGVDAVGTNVCGDRCVVQVKFRGNPLDVITYAEMAKTFTSGVVSLGLDPHKPNTIFLFTNASDVSHHCRSGLGDRLVVVSREIIKAIIDNNDGFWTSASKSVAEYLAKS